ncbi:MAG: hypothetical protein KME06_18300 [Kastovskya adunca ATA6-11-RM4]|jgi:hypothetical protein|nr:hypothetical protein [Kastovskya adunca ATA6-11-RM4]
MLENLFFRRNQKIKKVLNSDIIVVNGVEERASNLCLKNYGIPQEVGERYKVKVIFPRLKIAGVIEYIFSWHSLDEIDIPNFEIEQNDITLRAAKELAPLIKEHLQIEEEIFSLEEQYNKVNDLADLVSASELYSNQLELYEKALVQIENLLIKAKQLKNIYIHLINEGLIGIQIAGYNPDNIRDNRLAFDSKYRTIREEYQYMRDAATAYQELTHQQNE